ncbi:heme biosynthesis HemY N-terminal domain-containing protein [Chitinimonas lacunae]|uniref:Heme biosynthesis HemY N-terminal domain-containing protein n=1 Tax=Chitinimonas lacunae TaxID=1963018 RepID=A0ABV8MRM0_9NEIS
MRWLLWLMGLFALAVGISLIARLDTGYALLFLPPYQLYLSLNAFVLLFVFLVLGGYGLARLYDWVVQMPLTVKRFRAERRASQARRFRLEALTAWLEGRYHRAERAIARAREVEDDAPTRAVDALIGARTAHLYRDFVRRDRYLEEVRQSNAGRSLALAMVEAECLNEQYRHREALEALQHALDISPKLTAALKLELRLRQQEQNPARVLELADQLEKGDGIDPVQAARIRVQARLQQLAMEPMEKRELERWWQGLSNAERLHPRLAAATAREFVRHRQDEMAERILVNALEHQWDNGPVEVFGQIGRLGGSEHGAVRRLGRAEQWLQHRPNDHVLLLALGRLCFDAQLWGKARTYLEASLAVQESPIAHAELGQLLEQLGEHDTANAHYRQSLGLALDALEQRG